MRALRPALALLVLLGALPAHVLAANPSPTPLPPVANADPFFGAVQAVYAPDAAARAGVRWQRLVFWWSKMQPNAPGDDLRDSWFTDAQIDAEVARGVTPIGVVLSTPAWARRDPAADTNSVPKNLGLGATDPNNYWAQFMRRLAAKYAGRIDTWIVWNEPDMYKGNDKRTWSGGVDDYYQLLKGAYLGAKAGNPNAKVFVAGMTYWWDKENGRRQFLDDLLDRVAADPTAAANGYYFDGISVHAYANPLNAFVVPTIYRRFLEARGISGKPIWIQESNVVPRDDSAVGTWPVGGFRATLDEQASFVIESMALARAAGVERDAIYKMNDTGGEGGEFYGLARDNGSVRPAYLAYQTAATYFSGVRSATYSWESAQTLDALLHSADNRFQFIWPAAVNKVVLERPGQRITVVWNASPQRATARVTASAASAKLVTKLGETSTITPQGGQYVLDLEPSGNNSDTRDPSIYLVGGSPLILVEDATAPATPAAVDARIQIVWPHDNAPVTQAEKANVSAYLFQTGSFAPVACDFAPTVRLWAAVNNDPARMIATAKRRAEVNNTRNITAYDFDDVDVSAAKNPRNKIYFFVTVDGVQARSTIWSHGADARTYFPQPDVPTGVGSISAADAKIEIVWPHGDAPVTRASQANVTAALFARGTLRSADPTASPTLRLYRARDTDPGELVATGTKRITQANGLTYPVWDFNDVDVSAAMDPSSKLYFWVGADGMDVTSNVWSHGADARTIFPQRNVPVESCR